MALTRDQKMAIAWADYFAGLASAGLGAISFAIGAAASTAYYWTKKRLKAGALTFQYQLLFQVQVKTKVNFTI
jgi:hypothetical protein